MSVQQKKTLVLGASLKPHRYSYKAVIRLDCNNIPVVAVGMREGSIGDVKIVKPFPEFTDVHSITMYLGPRNQSPFVDYILKINPVRVIFNPGTENPEFQELLKSRGIEVVEKCMFVMLSKGEF
ncbi:MAG: CoA-binding protein [Bacteroidetes bacterium]|nr:CoA-binding protein [Bacteroidota bacterium]